MSSLTPPPSMAADWLQMLTGARNVAQATASVHTYAEAKSEAVSRNVERILYKGIAQLTTAAKHAGFNECSHFP